ncbi:MAG: type II toxin-antitoxin system VapC family toxin [Thaumarchaeota archaeon]|nr:type II toxin-antitoxin system VapC family toxin [Nitrososphaerota archaeon]
MKSLNALNMEQDVLTVANRYNMTYYDTAYVVVAMINNLELVTDDKKMKKSATEYGVNVYSSDAVGI